MSGDISKIMQACITTVKNTGKLIENAILQALTKPQDIMLPNPAIDSRMFGTNHASNSSYKTNWTMSCQTKIFGIPHNPNTNAYYSQNSYEKTASLHAYVGQ